MFLTFVCVFFSIGCSRTDTLFILLLIERVIECAVGLETYEFCIFNNDDFESGCRYCGIMTFDAATSTRASTDAIGIGIGSFEIGQICFYLFGILSPTTIAAVSIKNENEMKYEGGTPAPQPQPRPQAQSAHQTQHTSNKLLNFDLTGTGPREFGDVECIYNVLSSEDGFNCDINNVFKYWFNKNFNGNYHCNIYCVSAGMLAFDF